MKTSLWIMLACVAAPLAQASVLRIDQPLRSQPLADWTGRAPEGEWLDYPTNLVYAFDDAGELRLVGVTTGPTGYFNAEPHAATRSYTVDPEVLPPREARVGCGPGAPYCAIVNVALVGSFTVLLRSRMVCEHNPTREASLLPTAYVAWDVVAGYWDTHGQDVTTIHALVDGWDDGCARGVLAVWLEAWPHDLYDPIARQQLSPVYETPERATPFPLAPPLAAPSLPGPPRASLGA